MGRKKDMLKEARHILELQQDVEYGGGVHLANLVLEYFDDSIAVDRPKTKKVLRDDFDSLAQSLIGKEVDFIEVAVKAGTLINNARLVNKG